MNKFKELLERMPGAAGGVARWLDSKLLKSTPAISIPASLSLFATIQSDRVRHHTGLKPSLYTCVVAPSGAGKSTCQMHLTALLEDADAAKYIMGKPASDSGILRSLQEQSTRLLVWDEFGLALGELARTQTGYRSQILSTLMDLFSAGSTYVGREYAQQTRIDISNPAVSIYAGSTPNRFFGAISEDFIDDGFLSRWLLFQTETNNKEPNRPAAPGGLPEYFFDLLIDLINDPSMFKGNLRGAREHRLLTPEHADFERSLRAQYEMQRVYLQKSKSILQIFWTRAFEHYAKVCMALTDAKETQISGESQFWADELVRCCIQGAIDACGGNLYPDDKTRARGLLGGLIGVGETLTKKQVTRRCMDRKIKITRSEREAAIADLLEAGIWEEVKTIVNDSERKTTLYRRGDVDIIDDDDDDIPM